MSKKQVYSHDHGSTVAEQPSVVVTVRMKPALREEISRIAKQSQRSRSQIMQWALEGGLDAAKEQAGVVV